MPPEVIKRTISKRKDFFALEAETWAEMSTLWSGLPDAVLVQPGACGDEWSIKDLWNHLASWQEAAIRVIGDLLSGHVARLGASTEQFNHLHHDEDKGHTVEESRQRVEASRRRLLEMLRSLSDDQLLNEFGRQQTGWWAKWTTYAHYRQHIAGLTEFRVQRPL